MSASQPIPTKLPTSYPSLPYTEIRVSHHPESSKDVTPVLVCTLYRPKANNAFTDVMEDELEHFFGLASIDDRVKVIVLTGHGRMFCAGMDLNQGFVIRGGAQGKWETDVTHRDGGGRVSVAMHQCTKPTIVAINGHAIGVGITMTMPAVMRYVWTKAKVGFVFSRRGVVMEGCSSFFLPRLLGYARALQLVVSGATHQADSKHLDGLFTELVDRQEDVLPKALAQAEELARETSSVSTFMIREMMWRGGNSAEEAHLLESRVMGHMRGSKDNNEAVQAFLEKRNATFSATMKDDAPPVWPWFTPVNTKNRPVADPATNGKPKL